jgi:hypothetical protein
MLIVSCFSTEEVLLSIFLETSSSSSSSRAIALPTGKNLRNFLVTICEILSEIYKKKPDMICR